MTIKPRLRVTHVVVFTLVGLLVLAGAVLGWLGVSQAGNILEENWRGSYDILVTNEAGFKRISPGRDANGFSLIDDNHSSHTTNVISFDQLEQIDAIDSVEVAAPVAYIGRVANTVPWTYITKKEHNFAEEPVQDYEIHWSITDANGVLFDRTNNLRIDATNWNGEEGNAHEVGIGLINDFEPMDRHILFVQLEVVGDGFTFQWSQGPTAPTSIAAVNTEREMALLGEAGDFLQPLANFDALTDENDPLTVSEAFGADGERVMAELEGLPGTEPNHRPAVFQAYGRENPLIGYVRNTHAYSSTVLTATITGRGETSIDYADVMRPFNGGTYGLAWPGEVSDDGTPLVEKYSLGSYLATNAYPPVLTQVESPVDGQAALSASMFGIYGAFASYPGDIDMPSGYNQGDEMTYRNPSTATITVGGQARTIAAPFEVSTFTPGTVEPEGGYVPLGLYGANTLTYEGEPFETSRHGLGIETPAPSAIVSFEGAKHLTSREDIISTVRVRVAGLEGLSNDEALTIINDTAQQIRRIDGLDANVVISASTQEVNIWVPQYAFGTDVPQGDQVVGVLGWVQRDYGTVGVASWTASLTNQTVDRVATVCILLTSVFLLGLCFLARQERRTTHALLASQGWSTSERLRWTMREEWPGLTVFGLSAIISLIIASPTLRIAVLVAIIMLIAGLIIANPVQSRRLATAGKLSTRPRLVALAVAEGLSLGITAAAIGAVGMLMFWYYQLIAQTSLGATMTQALIPVLGAILVAGAVLIVTTIVTSQKSGEAMAARNSFSYWNLGRSTAKIQLSSLLPLVLHVIIAAAIVLLGRIYASGFQEDDTLYLLLAGGWIIVWIITRTSTALSWRPTRELPTYLKEEVYEQAESSSTK
ncbi:ABC transporter permease family protein [Flaviflexus massiliensis]|uniref:hypothetical protein n=1 Tax=Flaviflexus massiliensis TaxID=1522309 RepID=UPI0006D58A4D|nr:hypothetical protein [Flaviflexus massiliensis]